MRSLSWVCTCVVRVAGFPSFFFGSASPCTFITSKCCLKCWHDASSEFSRRRRHRRLKPTWMISAIEEGDAETRDWWRDSKNLRLARLGAHITRSSTIAIALHAFPATVLDDFFLLYFLSVNVFVKRFYGDRARAHSHALTFHRMYEFVFYFHFFFSLFRSLQH